MILNSNTHIKQPFSFIFPGYMGIGNVCIKFPAGSKSAIGPDSSFYDAIGSCGNNGDILYTPLDAVNNAVVKAALTLWVMPLMKSQSLRVKGLPMMGL